jgi:hypothetical protein
MQLGPDARARVKGEEADTLAAVAKRHDEQSRVPVLAAAGVTDGGAGAVIHLRFFAGLGGDYRACFRRSVAAQFAHEPLNAFVAAAETVPVHHLLPKGHGVATLREASLNELPIGFTDAGGADFWTRRHRCFGWQRRSRASVGVGGHPIGRFCGQRAGGPLVGRFAAAFWAPLPGRRTSTPASFKYPPAVSRRMPVAF